jgi:hypothetical protein
MSLNPFDQYAVTEPSSPWGVMPLNEHDLSINVTRSLRFKCLSLTMTGGVRVKREEEERRG